MTEEQNKLADRLQAMLNQVGHPDYSLRELYEGLKLIVWELRQEREPDPVLGECEECGHTIVTPLKRFREREPATEAVRDAEKVLRDSLQLCRDYASNEKIDRRYLGQLIEAAASAALALKGKGASQGAEGVGLTVHEADIIAAAVQLVPLLEEGWDEYDAPEDQSEGARACDALIKAVNAMLQAPDEQKG